MRIIFAVIVAIWGCNLIASPIDDLASLSQETRDAAAKILHATYVPPPNTNWDALQAQIKVGTTMTNVVKLIRKHNPKSECEMGASSGMTGFCDYRLDDLWMLKCDFEYVGKDSSKTKLIGRELIQQMRHIWVGPPLGFTGLWITYFISGQKSREINYKDGKYSGEFIAFNPDGSKCCVQHYDHQMGEGADTGYFPSGKIKYQGQYKTNVQVGTWVWYNEDGSTNSIKDYSKP